MIIRTPPQRKRRAEDYGVDAAAANPDGHHHESPVSDRRLVLVDDPAPLSAFEPPADMMVCTYQCRQMVKSEFVVALNTAEKQVADYQSRVETLSNELCTSEEERKKCRDHLCFVAQELEASKGREKALQEQLLKEVNDSQERYQIQVKHCSELEVKLKKEADLRRNAESAVGSLKDRALDLERKLQQLSENAEREKIHLGKKLVHLQDESKLSNSRITADLERMRFRAENSDKQSELLRKQVEDLREKLNECLHQKSEVECKLLSCCTASSHEDTTSEAQTLVKHLQEELRNYEAEVQEARRLKSSHFNNELLKERLLEEKGRRERVEKELSKLQEIQLNALNLELELTSWRSLLEEIPGVLCLGDIPKKFSGLQNEALENMMKVGEISANLKRLEVALEMAELGRQHAEKECALAKEKTQDLALEVKRLELMLSSVTEERERMKKDASTLDEQKHGHAESLIINEKLVKDLESSLLEKEKIIKELENNLSHQREVINRQHDELKLMNEKLSMETRKVKSLEREGDQLRSEISLLESKLGHGDYSTTNTKVLRMANTLAVDSDTKHIIEALRTELQKTQAKLQAVEELKGQSDAGNIIDADIPEKLAQLKGQIATLEKREERYKAVFAEKISVFRRACCLLFGYKIVMDDQQCSNGIPMTRFSLQSIYAQNDDEKLEFDYESGNMSILVNDYASQREISQQVEIFIRKWNSIPAFTANLTMESFNKRTLS